MGYPPLLERLASELREAALTSGEPAAVRSRLHALLSSQETCLVCDVREKAETEAIAALAKRLSEDRAPALSALSAICLPHLAMLADALPDAALIRTLAERQAKLFERYAEDMRRYALKWDALRRYLMSAEEIAAAEQAINALVGHRQVGFGVSSCPSA